MTAREQLADVIEDAIDNVHDMDVTHRDYANAAADAVLGMIKPLEFVRGTAKTPIATYIVAHMDNKPEEAPVWFIYCNAKPLGALGVFYNEKTAKAAANEHHRAQILAALGLTEEQI